MNADESKRLTHTIFDLDPEAAVDTCGPPDHTPFSVIFSANAKLTDQHLGKLSTMLCQLEYLNVGRASVSDTGISNLTGSLSLKIITVPFGVSIDTITDLFSIPTLRRLRMPLPDNLIETYRDLPNSLMFNDHITIARKSDDMIPLERLYPNIWHQIQW